MTTIKTLGYESTSYSVVKKWAAEFRRGKQSVEDCELSGHPKEATTDKNIELVHSLIMCEKRRSLRDIAWQISISSGAVQSILTDILGLSKVSARWVLRMLTKYQKSWFDISKYFLSPYEDDPEKLMPQVVTQCETWVHHFDAEAKNQNMQWKHALAHPPEKKEFLQQGRCSPLSFGIFMALSWWVILRKVKC